MLSIQEALGSTVSVGLYKPGLVVPSYNPSSQEMEAKDQQKFKVILSYSAMS